MEMPGLRLTLEQAQKMWALDATTCAALIAALVDTGFLFKTRDGAFMRLIDRQRPGTVAPRISRRA